MATAQLPAAGSVPSGLPSSEEVQEYEKILRISDEIFSGTHPRLKVPQQFVRKPASRAAPASTQAQVIISGDQPASPSGKNLPRSVTTPTISIGSQGTTAGNMSSSASGSSRIAPRPTSEIDPIFLTKSADLVRAELQLQRQRVERSLREQLEQRKQESRQKASIQDANPDFNVSDVLHKAFEMVNPSPSVDAPGAGASSESLDDNSFYSSRAPDSPQQGDQQRPSPAGPSNQEELATAVPAEPYSDELQRLEALNRPGLDQEMRDTYPVADHRLPCHQRRPPAIEAEYVPPGFQEPQPPSDAFEEPEYSPPAPGVAPMERGTGHEYLQGGHPSGARQRGQETRIPDRGRYARRSLSPGDDVKVIRNHITSPAAPQPSRVSPLATAKVPSVHQLKDTPPEYGPERQASPDVAPQPLVSRKRRRIHDEKDKARPVPYRVQPGRSDEPHIKEEPVSPPPFADSAPTYRSRQPQERPVYIDIVSPRYTPVIERRDPAVREQGYELDPYEFHGETGIPSTASRSGTRRPMRDDQDLRRVASLHQSRQQEYARGYVDPASPRGLRATSYAVVERSPHERARYYDELAPPATRRYIAAGETPSSPRYREAYYEEEPAARIIAPPPRRIVVDEHGNQYYDEPAPAPRMQTMLPPSARVSRSEIYDDPQAMHQGSIRAASVLEDPYGSRRYVQEMPPPQGIYRRVNNYTRPTPSDRRSYAAPLEEREPFPRSASVQVADYAARRPPYVEEAELPRERFVRIPSVRPPTARYEEPREMLPRVESTRPGGRDVSVYVDEAARRPREYYEQPQLGLIQ
ncbi:hypothetical protein EYZ11_001708 [Aspergillus tanneri]|uniref:Uncharacterized protein n=1 Tax=Aspergillus tanneri TaxID=1220188 RepID=A0A4S3JT98_9EURO|nr:hypothetical protein EYZ11_001708 [Aspergillus tanneri]